MFVHTCMDMYIQVRVYMGICVCTCVKPPTCIYIRVRRRCRRRRRRRLLLLPPPLLLRRQLPLLLVRRLLQLMIQLLHYPEQGTYYNSHSLGSLSNAGFISSTVLLLLRLLLLIGQGLGLGLGLGLSKTRTRAALPPPLCHRVLRLIMQLPLGT